MFCSCSLLLWPLLIVSVLDQQEREIRERERVVISSFLQAYFLFYLVLRIGYDPT